VARYRPGFAGCPAFDPATRDTSIDPVGVAAFIPSRFGSVADLRAGFGAIRIVEVLDAAPGCAAPMHVGVPDPTGASVAAAFLNGGVQITEAPPGTAEGSAHDGATTGVRPATLGTSARDTANRVVDHQTPRNRRARMLDPGTIDFAALPGVTFLPFDRDQPRDIAVPTLPGPPHGGQTGAPGQPFLRQRWPSTSAICTALRAAPLRRLSLTTHMTSPLSTVGSCRIRLT
jgi:hypothetical protein